MQKTTRYRLAPQDIHAHLFEVRCTLDDPAPDGQRFVLPVWIPGSYLVREFARHFVDFRAETNGKAVAIAKESKDTWRAAPCGGPLTVIAQVYAFDLSVRAAYLDATRGYFNGAVVLLCPEGRTNAPCEIEIVPPVPAAEPPWRVATTLARSGAAEFGFGTYRAASYDELIDHPVEMAPFALVSFDAGGARHDVAFTGRIHADLDRVARDLARICQWQNDLFAGGANGRAPFERYLFQVTATGDGYGGLEQSVEHEPSLPPRRAARDRRFARERRLPQLPRAREPRVFPQLEREADQARRVHAVRSRARRLHAAALGVRRHHVLLRRSRARGRHRQSVAESSFDAWIKFYRADENTPNAVVSYYAKGSLIALALDLTLRLAGSSLDALMRVLWQRYGQPGIGVPEDTIAAITTELAGRDLGEFFKRFVDGTEDPPLADLLASFGVALHVRAATSPDDRGGKPGKRASRSDAPACWLGAKLSGGSDPKLQHVYNGGPAERAGLAGGDVLAAIDGVRASADAVRRLLERRRAGETVTVHAFRRDELIVTELTLEAAPRDTCWLALAASIDGDVRARRDAWLGATA